MKTKYNKKNYKDKTTFFVRVKPSVVENEEMDRVAATGKLVAISEGITTLLRKSKCWVPDATLRHGGSVARVDVSYPYWMPEDEINEYKSVVKKVAAELGGDVADTYEEFAVKENNG